MICLAGLYFSFIAAGAAILADTMPAWAQDDAWGWMLGTPQPTAKDPGLPGGTSFSSGSFYWEWDRFIGPVSFICMLPVEGPAADVGDWDRNRTRLLRRAARLLQEAAETRLDDAAVDYLLADVARAGGDQARAAELVASGMLKCTGGRSFGILWQYQKLNNYSPRYLGGSSPEFPQAALNKGVEGDVVLDILLSPAGEVRQFAVVESPGESLTRAAEASLRKGRFEAARVGKYPIWSWLRVTTAFNLEG